MRSLESQANDEFLFVSNQVTFSAIDEDKIHVSSFGISKKIGNLGSIPINLLPPSQKLLRRIPSSATPSRALSPPLPPELVDLLPLSLRNHSTDDGLVEAPDLDFLSAECIDSSTCRTSTGSSNYDYITNNDVPPPPPVIRSSDYSLFSSPLICLDDAIRVNKSDTVKSDSSISTTTSTMSSSNSLLYGSDNGIDGSVKNPALKTPCVKNSKVEEDKNSENRNYFAIINSPNSEKLCAGTNDDKTCCSSWKNSRTHEISTSYFFNSRENVNSLNYPQLKNQVDPSVEATQQQQPREQVTTSFCGNKSREGYHAQNKLLGLMNPRRDSKQSCIFNMPTDVQNNYDALPCLKVPTSVDSKSAPKQESDGIYDNLRVFRNEETVCDSAKSQTPLLYRREMYSTINESNRRISSPFVAQSLQSILEVGKTESHLIFPCETCSYTAANSRRRSRSCERFRFSPPGSPLLGRKSASPWKYSSGNLPFLRFPKGTLLERPSEAMLVTVDAQNAFIDQREMQFHNNNWNPVQANPIYINRILNPKNPNSNIQDQLHPSKPLPLFISDNNCRPNVQNDKEKGKLKKSSTFYKCMKKWLKKS